MDGLQILFPKDEEAELQDPTPTIATLLVLFYISKFQCRAHENKGSEPRFKNSEVPAVVVLSLCSM